LDPSLVDEVWARAKGVCEYCLLPQRFDVLTFQVDHVVARKHHGTDALENLALACFACNNHKGANIAGVDPTTGGHRARRRWRPRRTLLPFCPRFRYDIFLCSSHELFRVTPAWPFGGARLFSIL